LLSRWLLTIGSFRELFGNQHLSPTTEKRETSSLLRFAPKTPKNRLSADFLPYKQRSYQRYAQPDNRGFFAASSAKNPQVQQDTITLISLKSIFKKLTTKEHEGAQRNTKYLISWF
jgi:hypothetical protein